MTRIVSWNVNGIRSLPKPLEQTLTELNGDICCFQEVKLARSALEYGVAFVDGYNSYFSFCRKRDGYSGVATYCRTSHTPVDANEGLTGLLSKTERESDFDVVELFAPAELKDLDWEGRTLISRHRLIRKDNGQPFVLNIINVYCPRFDCDRPDRQKFRLDFYRLLELRAQSLLARGDHVLIVGDVNCSHKRIDHCEPEVDFEKSQARLWMDSFLYDTSKQCDAERDGAFVDVFRAFYPDRMEAYTCWNTAIRARETNFGTRIDYAIADRKLYETGLIVGIDHLTDFFGSDHCPVVVQIDCDSETGCGQIPPPLCTKYMPELKGAQQKLHSFVIAKRPLTSEDDVSSSSGCSQESNSIRQKTRKTETLTLAYFWNKTSSEKVVEEKPEKSVQKSPDLASTADRATVQAENAEAKAEVAEQWKALFNASSTPVPMCTGHNLPCTLKTVKKAGPNKNRRFYACPKPAGKMDDPNAQCGFFRWT